MYQILQKFDIHWHDGGPSIAMMYHLRGVSDLLCNWKSCLLCYMKDVVLHCSIFFKWNKLVRVRVRVRVDWVNAVESLNFTGICPVGSHWFGWWSGARLAPCRHPTQSWHIVNWKDPSVIHSECCGLHAWKFIFWNVSCSVATFFLVRASMFV